MPRIIVKCKYLKGGKHREFYTKYMATREGAEKIGNSFGKADATAKQKEMIHTMLKDFPDGKKLFEYEDYAENPNRENASELISAIMDHNIDTVATKENYVDYIANRPRVEKLGEHGLFSDSDDEINLNETAREVANHQGNVWTNIISIKREDAVRLGYDNAKAWRNLCRAKRNELAEAMKIEPSNLKWYASFHNEGHHPHIHLIVYSKDINQGYLTKQGIEQMRSIYGSTIFKQDLINLYEKQTTSRDEIKQVSKERMQELLDLLNQPIQENDKLNELVQKLQNEIRNHKGKLVYGFLKADAKKIVDEIVSVLEKDERIKELYDSWYLKKEEIQRTYRDDLDERLPLHEQKEFKSIKNMILQTVKEYKNYDNEEMKDEIQNAEIQMEMQDESFDPDFNIEEKSESNKLYKLEWNDAYKDAMNFLCGTVLIEKDEEKAMELLKMEAENQNVLALFALGNIYQRGIGDEANEFLANDYYIKAFEGFNLFYEVSISEKEKQYLSYYIGKSYLYGLGVEKDDSKAVKYFNNCRGNKYAEYLLYKAYMNLESEQAINSLMISAEYGYDLAQFQLGKKLLDGIEIEKNINDAVKWLRESASQNNKFAQYQLGKLFLFGKEVPKDEVLALQYLEASASQGNVYAQWLLDHKDDYQTQPFMLVVSRFFHHLSKMFENQMMPDKNNPLRNTDSKLRKKIQEKRAALGHKDDDHTMNL